MTLRIVNVIISLKIRNTNKPITGGSKMNKQIITITLTTRDTASEYDLFSRMNDSGMGALNAIDNSGNPVDMPQELRNSLLAWAGYDVAK